MKSSHATLVTALWPAGEYGNWLRGAMLALAGTGLLALSAKVQIPFYPVPMTMQTLVVVLIGAAYGPRLGVATILLYLAEGMAGLPVFAGTPEKGLGLAYMMGPTGGYLLGFLLAALLAGMLARRGWDRHPVWTFAMMAFATALIYLPGLMWLGLYTGWEPSMLFAVGLWPFLLADLLKAALATALLPGTWWTLRRLGLE